MQHILSSNKQRTYSGLIWALVALWLLMQYWLYTRLGVKIVFDSHRYIEEANRLGSSAEVRLSYLSYSLILSTSLRLTGAVSGVVWLQVLYAGIAALAFFKLAYKLCGNRLFALFATFLLIIWPDYQQWNFYIHTESLFVSTIILVFLRMITAKTAWHYLQLAMLLLFLMFLRSNGFMVTLAVISYMVSGIWLERGYKLRWLFVILLVAGVPILITLSHFFLQDMKGIHSFSGHLTSGNVIQGYEKIKVTEPKEFILTGAAPLQQFFQVVWQEPVFFFKKSLLRCLYYWGQIRPYFATRHNWAICLFFYPQYLLVLYCLLMCKVPVPLIIAVSVLAMLMTALVVIGGVDWDNRFMMPLLPFVYLLAATGLSRMMINKLGLPV